MARSIDNNSEREPAPSRASAATAGRSEGATAFLA